MLRVERIEFIKEFTLERNRLERKLVTRLEETVSISIATDTLAARMALANFFKGNMNVALSEIKTMH